jgi:hypothetical protein
MVTFIANIETRDEGLLEFFFVSVSNSEENKYFVTTIDKSTRSHVFYMIEVNYGWRIDTSKHRIEPWLLEMEFELGNLINEKG